MLILKAKIKLNSTKKGKHYSFSNILRPAIKFGELLFSGQLSKYDDVDRIEYGREYVVMINQPTINDEAYNMIKEYIYEGAKFKIHEASKELGDGEIIEYLYIPD